MIIVTGSVTARPDTLAEVLRISVEHVHRSRAEPGCLLHSVHQDVENPLRLLFLEHWADRATLSTHFTVDTSKQFAQALRDLGDGPSSMDIYDASPIPTRTLN